MQVPQRIRQIGWFVAIWVMSVGALAVVAYAIRLMIVP